MKKTYLLLSLFIVYLTMPFGAFADSPHGSVYLDGGDSKRGVILAHGKGKYPTWLVVDPLRKGINDQLGYHTLSLQMPVGYSDWRDYADAFPQAYKTIEEAIAFLKNEKGVTHVYLIGHSMGSRMSGAFVAENSDHGLAGLVVVGCRNNGARPLSCDQNMKGINLPILDVWGGGNGKDSKAASERSDMVSDTYTQIEIEQANHKFEDHEDELVDVVTSWLKIQNQVVKIQE